MQASAILAVLAGSNAREGGGSDVRTQKMGRLGYTNAKKGRPGSGVSGDTNAREDRF